LSNGIVPVRDVGGIVGPGFKSQEFLLKVAVNNGDAGYRGKQDVGNEDLNEVSKCLRNNQTDRDLQNSITQNKITEIVPEVFGLRDSLPETPLSTTEKAVVLRSVGPVVLAVAAGSHREDVCCTVVVRYEDIVEL
jgi:hypothetical protein